jgi:VCBS repeat-containing protein
MTKQSAPWSRRLLAGRNLGSRKRQTGSRLSCEALEPRRLLTVQTWVSSGVPDNNWLTASNFSFGPVEPGDTLLYNSSDTSPTSNNDDANNDNYSLEFDTSGYDLIGDGISLDDNGGTAILADNPSGTNTIDLPLTISGNATANVTTTGSTLLLDNSSLSGPSGATLTTEGNGLVSLSTNFNATTFNGTVIDQGALEVDGTLTPGSVEIDGGILTGSGTVGPITATTTGGGLLEPVGTFSAGAVTLDSATAFAANLFGPSVGQYSQLSASGPVNLDGATLVVQLNYVPSSTDSWTIIISTSNAPVQGTFVGLPQGATIAVGGVNMRINYAGGQNGDDVTLSVVAAPVANPDFYTTPENTTLFVPAPGVLTNDTDPQNLTLHPVLLTTPTHGTLTLSDDGSFTYAPATGFSGPDNFTYEAYDGLLASPPTTVSLVVNPVNLAPQVGDVTYSGLENTKLSIGTPGVLASAVSPEGLTLSSTVVSRPSHGALMLDPDGSFSYLPVPGFTGLDSFTFIAQDSNGLTSAPATATINVGTVDVASTLTDSAFSVAENGSIFVAGPGVLANADNPSGNTLSAVLLTSTTHGSLSLNADGSFTYTPGSNFAGTDSFTYEATDGTLLTNIATVTLTIEPVPIAPTAGDDSYSVLENETLIIAAPGLLLNDTNPSGDALSVIVVNGPLNVGAFNYQNDGSFTYVPANNFSGTDAFTYYLDSGGLVSNLATVTITVVQAPVAPTAGDDNYSTNENSTLTVAAPGVLANDTDPNGLLLSAVLQAAPAHGALTLSSDGSFVYTPTANYSGNDTFTYLANDGKRSSGLATVTIMALPVSIAPTAGNASFSVLENQTLTVGAPGLLLYSQNPNGDAQILSVVNGPLHGVLTPTSPVGGFIFAPSTNFAGTDSFSYFLTSDGLNSNVATITLTVAPVTLAPIVNLPNLSYTTNENTVLSVAAPGVLSNVVDPNGLTLSAVLETAPSHGALTLSADGAFVYTPASNYSGIDSFSYLASNGKLFTQAMIDLTVVQVALAPSVENASFTTSENETLTVPAPGVLGSALDPNNLPLTAYVVNTILNGTLTLNDDGAFNYVPAPNFSGTDSFTFRATNGALSSNLGTVSINVAPVAATTVDLNPASDTGVSSTDRITRDTTPNFFGTTGPGLTVVLYAQLVSDPGTPTEVGQTTADSAGNYSVAPSPLADGVYAFAVGAFRNGGLSTGTVSAGNLLIDTVSPVITDAVMVPKTGQIYVTFQDNSSGMNLAALTKVSYFSFTRPTSPTPRNYLINSARVVPPVSSPIGPVTVVLKVANGHRILHGRYLLAVLSGGATDVAGNPLDGNFSGTFPTGDGVAGSQFDALFLNQGFKPSVPVATNRFVPVLTKSITRARLHHQVAKLRGPLAHLTRHQKHP